MQPATAADIAASVSTAVTRHSIAKAIMPSAIHSASAGQ
jgi:hypothetical protein